MSRSAKTRSGSALIELALILPLFLTMLLGAVHFGYLFFLYNGLEKSVRDGARYAASRTFTTKAAYSAVVQSAVVYGTYGGTTPIVAGLTSTNMVQVTPIPDAAGVRPVRIRVAITGYTYNGVLSAIIGGTTLNGKPSLEVPFIGFTRF